MRPNDIFKRPGPHHAVEADLERLAQLRTALAVLEDHGSVEPLTEFLSGRSPLEEPALLSDLGWEVASSNDFGLRDYGSMFFHAGLQTISGDLLYPQRDARRDAISHVWFELDPHIHQRVAPASAVLTTLDALRNPPSGAWERLRKELRPDGDDCGETDEAGDREMVEQWRRDCRAELDSYGDRLTEIAGRGGAVVLWESEQGWL